MRSARSFVFAFVVLVCLCVPATSSAYEEIRGWQGEKNPCAQAGIGAKGGATSRVYADPQEGGYPVTVTLMCSPRKPFPSFTVSRQVRDWAGKAFFAGPAANSFGVPDVVPSFVHGNVFEALRLSDFNASEAVVAALTGAGISLGSSLAVSLITCAAAGIPTLGLSCAAAGAIVGGAVISTLVGAVSGVVKQFVQAQFNRYLAISNAKWFVWMERWGMFWSGQGGAGDLGMNPFMSNARVGPPAQAQIGVQFTSAPAGGGPDFGDIGGRSASAAEPDGATPSARKKGVPIGKQLRSLNFNHGDRGIDPNGRHRVRTGGRGNNVLRGSHGDDTLQGRAGHDRLIGGRGSDTMLGGRGRDRLNGGPGDDYLNGGNGSDRLLVIRGDNTLFGGSRRDVLRGGTGSDTLVDWQGPTRVWTGRTRRGNRTFVNVRDARGDDRVICLNGRSTVIADRGDFVGGRCGTVIRRGRRAPRR